MKKVKALIVVLTLSASIMSILGYMIATNKLVGTSNDSLIILLQDANNNDNLEDITTKVSSTILTEDKIAEDASKSEVTSRSGFHEAKTDSNETDLADTNSVETDSVTEEPVEEPKPTYEGVELEYSARYSVSSSPLSKSKGVVYFNGHKETYYSQKVLPGKGLNIPGRHVDSRELVCDGDGYISISILLIKSL